MLCDFFLFNLKPMFSVSLPIACIMAYPNIIAKMYGAGVSPCKTRANNSNSFVSPSGDKTFFLCFHIIVQLALLLNWRKLYSENLKHLLCMLLKTILQSIKINVAFIFLSFIPSINLLRDIMQVIVDLSGLVCLNPY